MLRTTKTKPNLKENRLPRSVHLLGWTLITAAAVSFGLPLIYDIYLSFTPSLEPHIEQKTQLIAEQSAIIIGIVILILGVLLAIKRWRWERKRARIQALVRDYRLRKYQELKQAKKASGEEL